jgi:S-adenosylmethionine hydrolase
MKPILVFQTDFTYKESAVAAMYGVVKSVDRELEIMDATHEIPQYDIWSASYRLFQPMQFLARRDHLRLGGGSRRWHAAQRMRSQNG